MKRFAVLTPSILLIAACSGGSDTLQPGQWETTVQIANVEVPGAPPEVAEQMAMLLRQAQTESHCLTPEQAADPTAGMANPTGRAEGCTFSERTFSGGRIHVVSSCPAPAGQGEVRSTLEGTYTPTNMEAQMNVEGPSGMPGTQQTVRLTGTMTSRRTGDCSV